jgi:hypothetical protein
MSSGQVITDSGKKIVMNSTWKAIPDYTIPSLFKVGTGITTPSVTDTDLITPVIISGISYTKAFEAGYPDLSETTFNITTRCMLLTTEANGNSLTEFGIVNTDGTPLLFSRAVHTAVTKTNTVQAIYVQKDIVEIN